MRRRACSWLVVSFVLILALAGCGNGIRIRTAEPPTGTFSNASLSGTYAFSLSGTNTSGFFASAGSFTADGGGNISSGVQDVNAAAGVFTNLAISGTYSVSADGRGIAILNSSVATMTLDFVLISSQHGLVARFDSNATASGTLDRQDPAAFTTATVQGPFAFSVSGVNSTGGNIQSAGAFIADGAGSITSGVHDQNDAGVIAGNVPLQGSYSVSGANGRGLLQLTSSAGTQDFAFYVVDANRLKLVQTDFVPAMAGDAHRQEGTPSNASLTGTFAFTLGGSSSTGAFAAGGIFTADGSGTIAAGTEDVNNGGTVSTNLGLSGTYSIGANSRGTMTLTTSKGTSNFAIYPSTGGVQILQLDSTATAGGAAFVQTGTMSTATIQGDYGLNLTAATNNGPSDTIARFTANGTGGTTGAMDTNMSGSLAQNLGMGGGYSIGTNGRGTWLLRTSLGNQNLVLYVVDGTRVLVLETDSATIAVGSFERQ